MLTAEELCALNRHYVTLPRTVRKTIFRLQLWQMGRQRLHSQSCFQSYIRRRHTTRSVNHRGLSVGQPVSDNTCAPNYLSNHVIPVSAIVSRQHLWSAQQNTLVVPRYRLTTYGCQAFSVAGPTAWNSLPVAFRDPTISDACFRRFLKTVLLHNSVGSIVFSACKIL